MSLFQCLLNFILILFIEDLAYGCNTATYTGNVSITNGGRVCQNWVAQEPHVHTNNQDNMFPEDGSAADAMNYCRPLLDDPLAWCYTADKYIRWEYCDMQICEENGRCGGVISDDSGTISSVDADNNGLYDPDKDCLWTLEAPVGKFVRVEFLTFDLENSSSCEMDFLQVYESTFSHGRYCGFNLPPVLVSKSRILYLRFYSDPGEEGTGFTARYSHVSEGLSDIPQEFGNLICPQDVDLLRYNGDVSTNNEGHACVPWVQLNIPQSYFNVDGSKEDANAYCRNINVMPNSMPWCLSSVTFKGEFCHEKICRGLGDVTTPDRNEMSTRATSTVDSTYVRHTTSQASENSTSFTKSMVTQATHTNNHTVSTPVYLTVESRTVDTYSSFSTFSATDKSTPFMMSTSILSLMPVEPISVTTASYDNSTRMDDSSRQFNKSTGRPITPSSFKTSQEVSARSTVTPSLNESRSDKQSKNQSTERSTEPTLLETTSDDENETTADDENETTSDDENGSPSSSTEYSSKTEGLALSVEMLILCFGLMTFLNKL